VQLFARWQRISRYDRPGAWVRRVAIRMAVRAERRDRLRAVLERPQERPFHDDSIPDVDLAVAIAALPLMQRTAIVLFYFEDLPVPEIAAIVRRAEATVRSDLLRARRRLADSLGEELKEADDVG
jgi:DNA-directed RNA polymerase specialized sigma24 family protein